MVAVAVQLARLGLALGDVARGAVQQILALDPGNVPAMQQMADLYRSTQQWDTLAQVLGRLVEMTKDPAILSATSAWTMTTAAESPGSISNMRSTTVAATE